MNRNQLTLDQLPVGSKANVTMLTSDGTTRRRMIDLGGVNGTEIDLLYRSTSCNPVAYLIRGAVIALRSDVSEKIVVSVS